jgi:hypothetical protein
MFDISNWGGTYCTYTNNTFPGSQYSQEFLIYAIYAYQIHGINLELKYYTIFTGVSKQMFHMTDWLPTLYAAAGKFYSINNNIHSTLPPPPV